MEDIGGLVGVNDITGSIIRSSSAGTVTAGSSAQRVGGFVGSNYGKISDSYASVAVTGDNYSNTGGLVGENLSTGSISSSYATGAISGYGTVGGLVGSNQGSILDSYATGSVGGYESLGGLVGENEGSVTNSHATGNVLTISGGNNSGGLVGFNTGSISDTYATGDVTGEDSTGGLVGRNVGSNSSTTAEILDSYATGVVIGASRVGGLVGYNLGNQTSTAGIANSYATGAVTGTDEVGGLVGRNYGVQSATASIDKSLAVNSVTGTTKVGGLVGANVAGSSGIVSVTASFYDNSQNGAMTGIGFDGTNTSPADVAGQVEGKTPTELGDIATFQAAGWNIAQNNSLTAGALPKLGWQVSDSADWVINSLASVINLSFTLSPLGGTYTYQGTPYLLSNLWSSSAIFGNSYSNWVLGTDYTFQYGGNTVTSFTNAATYSNIGISILKSGYQVASNGNTSGLLTISRANATVTGNSASGTYTGLPQSVSGFTVSGLVNNETASVLSSPTATGATGTNAGSYTNTVTGNAADGNYALTFANGTLTINRANATVTGNSASGTYTGLPQSVSGFTVSGLVNNETASVLSSPTASGATGINAGSYTNTVTGNATDGNYALTFANGTLTIAAAQIPPPPISPILALPIPESSPAPIFVATSNQFSGSEGASTPGTTTGGISVSLVRVPSVQEVGLITVSVPKEMATAGAGFTFPLPAQVAEAAANQAMSFSLANGDPLPAWLSFNAQSMTFVVTAVPDGAFPVQVVIAIGGNRFTIQISERSE